MNKRVHLDYQTLATAEPTKCSLLIPDRYLGYFNERCLECGSRKQYLYFLINSYLPLAHDEVVLLKKAREPQWNTHYQKSGQGLKKRNLVPDAEDWAILRNAAACFGVSMCFLFVFLMELEMGPPPNSNRSTNALGRSSTPNNSNPNSGDIKFCVLVRKIDSRARRYTKKLKIINY